ncbi:MAG: hypothetical protein WA418_08065 [Bradyrhizobium sp.]
MRKNFLHCCRTGALWLTGGFVGFEERDGPERRCVQLEDDQS